jgi:hypothetical protein
MVSRAGSGGPGALVGPGAIEVDTDVREVGDADAGILVGATFGAPHW